MQENKVCIDCGKSGRQKGRKRCRACWVKHTKKGIISHPNSLKALKEGRKKAKPNLGKFREKSANWKGGKTTDSNGYILLRVPEHPNNSNGYVKEHRLVIEKMLGRYLESWEWVHHKNGKNDDNRLENLQIVFSKTHYGEVRCPHCRNNFLIK